MKSKCHKGSFTIEATLLVPLFVFITMAALRIGIDFFQASATRESCPELKELDIVMEFYNYQAVEEIGREIFDD